MTRVKVINGQAFSVFLDTSAGGYSRGQITDCVFEDSGGAWDTFGSGQLSDYTFKGCHFRNSTGQGFATTNSTLLTIVGNTFEGPLGNGISLEPAQHVTIVGNTFHNLSNGAIAIKAAPASPAISVDPKNIVVEGNTIVNTGTATSATDYGVALKNTVQATVTGNVIDRMGRAGILIQSATLASSGSQTKNVAVTGNVVSDSNQDNAALTPHVLIDQSTLGGAVQDVTVEGNQLVLLNGDSHATHGILEIGAVDFGVYRGNDVRGNVTAGIGFGSATSQRVAGNLGYNPVGQVTAPAFPATTVAATNTSRVDVTAFVTNGTSAITQIAVGGVNTNMNIDASKWAAIRWPAGQTIAFTYAGGSPAWVLMGD